MLFKGDFLLPLLSLFGVVLAGGSESPAAGWTDWVTDYVTVTSWEVSTTTVVQKTTITDVVTTTVTIIATQTLPPVTQTQTETVTVPGPTQTVPGPTETVTATVTNVVTQPPVTVTVTGPGGTVTAPGGTVTVTAPGGTVTVTAPGGTVTAPGPTITAPGPTVTSVAISTSIVSTCPTKPLTGLVPCPSRTLNPTYTPSAPLPSDYLWGCPPGTLCHPVQENCNFESNTPAFTYFCSPDECLPVVNITESTQDYFNTQDVNDTCAWLVPQDSYFNINPTFFGLNFNIFLTDGQAPCTAAPPPTTYVPPPPPPSTTYVPPPPPPSSTYVPPPPPPTTTLVASTWVAWTPSPQTTYVYTSASLNTWSEWVSTTVVVPVSPTPSTPGWNGWSSAPPAITPRADLAARQDQGIIAPPQCYAICNNAANLYESVGHRPQLCSTASSYQIAYTSAEICISAHKSPGQGQASEVFTVFQDAISYCNGIKASSTPAPVSSAAESSGGGSSSSAAPVSSSAAASSAPASSAATTAPASTAGASTSAANSSPGSVTSVAPVSGTSAVSSGPISSYTTNMAVRPIAVGATTNSILSFIVSLLALFFRV